MIQIVSLTVVSSFLVNIHGEPERPDSGVNQRAMRRPYDTWRAHRSAKQPLLEVRGQAEEHGLPRVPSQEPVHDFAPRLHDLTWNPDKRVHKRTKLHAQHSVLFLSVFLAPPAVAR